MLIVLWRFRYNQTVRVSKQIPVQKKIFTWCLNLPPRCSKYKMEFQTHYTTQVCVKFVILLFSFVFIWEEGSDSLLLILDVIENQTC